MVMPMDQTAGLARSLLCDSDTLALSGNMSAWLPDVIRSACILMRRALYGEGDVGEPFEMGVCFRTDLALESYW